jgi:stalled ribosome rescue protein Dom34
MTNQKEFGVWMDTHHAVIVGRENIDEGDFKLLAHVEGEENPPNTEKHANNTAMMVQAKFFKEIASHMQNATHIHITGTGQAQEQFIHYLAETPQFKNTKTEESTSNRMSDENFIGFISGKFPVHASQDK